jgi:hypothetical protein
LNRKEMKHRFIVNPARIEQRRMFGQHRVSFRRVLDYRVDESTDESPRQVARGGQSASSLLILLALQDR